MTTRLKLSVHIVTYNHAGFIRQALDSVLMQTMPWEYEVLVGDDASTDGTAEILKEYQLRFPGRVRPILREKNLGPGPNAVDVLERCSGEYVAFLEGDDYWIDPDKLRSQIAYLDQHPQCTLIHHGVEHISWPAATTLGRYPAPQFRISQPHPKMLAMVNYIQTCAVMFRRSALPKLGPCYSALRVGDWPLFVLLTQNGWVGYIDRVMSHYRIHSSNSWNNREADYKMRAMKEMAWYLLDRVEPSSKRYWQNTILALAFKEIFLSVKTKEFSKVFGKLNCFFNLSVQFRKPLWLVSSLLPYYRANYSRREALETPPQPIGCERVLSEPGAGSELAPVASSGHIP